MSIPYWRYVEYTDDGCTIYQCLDCKEKWEARTPPGWMDHLDEVDGPDPDGKFHTRGDDSHYHIVSKDEPVYHPVFKFCPYCGINWKGPIRRDQGNEQMLGPKRLKRYNQIKDDGIRGLSKPTWWWVIQVRGGLNNTWKDDAKLSPFRYSANQVYTELQELRERERTRHTYRQQSRRGPTQLRVITCRETEMSKNHPVAWSGLKEIDWREIR